MNWLLVEIITGFRKLVCLSLEGTPATDVLEGTALAWVEAMHYGRDWQQARDTARIRTAFLVIANTADRWPSPRRFMAAIPAIEQRALPKPTPAHPEVAAAALQEIGHILHVEPAKDPELAPPPGGDPWAALSQIEQDLQKHYAAHPVGKMAAAGPDA